MNLLACGSCSRQYDVTHLDPGDLIRCACDTVCSVPAHAPLSVTALCCTNCGGVVKPGDEACPYCEAALDPKAMESTTLCPKCFARIADDSRHCSGCGIEIRPQPLTPIPNDKSCPRCKSELQIRALGKCDVIECSSCLGLWVRSESFDALCRDAVVEGRVELPDWPEAEESASSAGPFYIPCMQCDSLMQRRQYRHHGRATGVIIDFCRQHGIWLDHRELERIATHLRLHGGAIEPLFKSMPALAPAPGPKAKPNAKYGDQNIIPGLGHVIEIIVNLLSP